MRSHSRSESALHICKMLFLACIIILGAWDHPALASGIKLTVNNPESCKYDSFPITSGVPISEAMDIKDTSGLVILDANGKPVPAQFKVLSRWGALGDASKPIKWILCDFQASLAPKGKAHFTLAPGPSQAASGEALARIDAETLIVDTGALSFKVKQGGFRLPTTAHASERTENGLCLVRNGVEYFSSLGDGQAVIEENGPLRTVIRFRGNLKDTSGRVFTGGDARPKPLHANGGPANENLPLTYTVRITAYKNKKFLKIQSTFENTGNSINTWYPVNDCFIDGLKIIIPLSPGEHQAHFANQKSPIKMGSVLQLHSAVDKNNEHENFIINEKFDSKSTNKKGRYPGWVEVSGKSDSIVAFLERFWERFPKSLEVTDNSLLVGLLPDAPEIPIESNENLTHYSKGRHYFSAGWHMTDTLWIQYDSDGPRIDPAALSACFATPLMAMCAPDWFARSGAWSRVAPAGFRSSDPRVDKALGIHQDMMMMPVDKTKSKMGLDLNAMREKLQGGRSWYGWEHFGDIVHSYSLFSSLVYDWPYIMWINYARTADERLRGKAFELTEHSIDMDQLHGGPTDGIWLWEKIGPDLVGFHHKSSQNAGYLISHTWNGGYALGYLFTGDPRWLEATERSTKAAQKYYSKVISGQKMIQNQTRSQGWSILLLTNLYRITGDKTLLEQANRIFADSLLYTEQLPNLPGSGGNGYITETEKSDGPYNGKAVVTFQTYPLEPLCEFHMEAQKAGLDVSALEAYILRCLDFLKNKAFVGGETRNGKYSVLSLSYATDPINLEKNQGGELFHNILLAGPYAYAATQLLKSDPQKASEYYTFARKIFTDSILYFSAEKTSKNDFLDPNLLSAANWPWLPVMPKVYGWYGRGAQYFFHAEHERNNSKK